MSIIIYRVNNFCHLLSTKYCSSKLLWKQCSISWRINGQSAHPPTTRQFSVRISYPIRLNCRTVVWIVVCTGPKCYLGRASIMKSLCDWALASMMSCTYLSSSRLRFPLTPTRGWAHRHNAAWLSGCIQDRTGTLPLLRNTATWRRSSSVAAAGTAHTAG